jgi:hypothetical protein
LDRADELCLERRAAAQRLSVLLAENDAMYVLLDQISKLRRYTHTGVDTLKAPGGLIDAIDVTVKSVRKGRQRGI